MDQALDDARSVDVVEREASPRYRADIDGLRAVAVISVVLFHAGLQPFHSGFVGVDIFFVISGYLIGGIVYRETWAQTFRFVTFYARRARRILPALIAVSVVTCALGCALLSPDELRRSSGSVAYALLGVSNIHFWLRTDYFSPDAHLDTFLMTWSLGIEEQFYLFFPVLLLLMRRFVPKATLPVMAGLTVVSFGLSEIMLLKAPVAAFYLLPSRAWELGIGALLAIWQIDGGPRFSGARAEVIGTCSLACLLLSVIIFNEQTPFPGVAAALPALGAAGLIASERSFVNRRVLSARPLVGVGLVSYSWYLWHWPLMAYAWICSAGAPSSLTLGLIALLSFVLAYLSWRFIERPFRIAAMPNRKALVRYAFALAVSLLVPFGLKLTHGLPHRMTPQVAAVEDLVARGRGNCLAGYGDARLDRSAACASVDARPRVALIGDSHAAALGSGLRQAAQHAGLGFIEFTKSSCPPLLGATRAMPNHPGHAQQCASYNRQAIAAVLADPWIKTVFLTGYWAAASETPSDAYIDVDPNVPRLASGVVLTNTLETTERAFLKAGKSVVVFGDVPRFKFDPVRQTITDLMPLRQQLQHIMSPSFATQGGSAASVWVTPATAPMDQIVERSARAVPGVRYVSLSEKLCNQSGCRFSDGRLPFYFDQQHLSQNGAQYVLRGVLPPDHQHLVLK
ncbi:acyltransferase family protein [Caulobacter sp. S45]|uniref:acyltransferase family protein n=1 Tax=Caulobacter sp. S45 TaxID=1641861 RepID=UPI00131BF413|nr:acyltransferase family protein [Caulobacter sp. S45]